jgi:hypothetical protein
MSTTTPVAEIPRVAHPFAHFLQALNGLAADKSNRDPRLQLNGAFLGFDQELKELSQRLSALTDLLPASEIHPILFEARALHRAFETISDNLLQSGSNQSFSMIAGQDLRLLVAETIAYDLQRESAEIPPFTPASGEPGSWSRRRQASHLLGQLSVLTSEWIKDAELSLYQLRVVQHCNRLVESLSRRVGEGVAPLLTEIGEKIDACITDLKAVDDERPLMLKVLANERALTKQLRTQNLPRVLSSIDQLRLDSVYSDALVEFERYLTDLSDEHVLVSERRGGMGLRRIRIPLKDLVKGECLSVIRRTAESESERLQRVTQDLKRGVTMVDPGITMAFSMARQQLKDDVDEAAALSQLLQDLARHSHRVVDFREDLFQRSDALSGEVDELSQGLVSQVGQLMDSQHLHRLQLRLLRVRTFGAGRALLINTLEGLERLLPHGWQLLGRARAGMGKGVRTLRQVTGLTEERGIKSRLAGYLEEVDESVMALPGIYRHLFRQGPLTERSFYSCRDHELAEAERCIADWQAGDLLALCIRGEAGSGKSTLIGMINHRLLPGTDSVNISVGETMHQPEQLLSMLRQALAYPDAPSLSKLAEAVNASERRRLVLLEDLHRLYLRSVDGFGALREFLLFMVETRSSIGWVVTCGGHAWNYLLNVLPLDRYFRSEIPLNPLSAPELEELIMRRHGVSGFRLHFDPALLGRSRLRDDDRRQLEARRVFFQHLAESSAGNIGTAIRYWLISIRSSTEDALEIGDIREFDASFLKLLPDEDLFYLTALLQHNRLTAASLARVFRCGVGASRLVLDRLREAGVLTAEEETVRIEPVLYRPVVRALRLRNMIS